MGWFGDALKSAGNATADGLTGGLASGITGAVGGLFGMIGAKKRMQRQVDAQKQLNEQAAKQMTDEELHNLKKAIDDEMIRREVVKRIYVLAEQLK
jgi:hypothetical protein